MAEFEITQSEYITANTTKNQNFADVVEGAFYKKTLSEDNILVDIPAADSTDVSWEDVGEYDEKYLDYNVKLKVSKANDIYRICLKDENNVSFPIMGDDFLFPIVYDRIDYNVYAIYVRLNTVFVDDYPESVVDTLIKQKTIATHIKYTTRKTVLSKSKTYDVDEDDSPIEKTWRLYKEIEFDDDGTAISFFNAIREYAFNKVNRRPNLGSPATAPKFQIYSSVPTRKIVDGKQAIVFWSICSILAGDVANDARAAFVSSVTSIAADISGEAIFIPVSGKYYHGLGNLTISVNIPAADFDVDSSSLEIKYKKYSSQKAKFSLSHSDSPTTKYTTTETELLTKASYVKRYNEDGSLSKYKQPLFSEITDTLLSNMKENRKTTQVEYVGKNNIKVGDTFYYAKDPTTKYIVTKTYLKANPFFVKTIYGRQIL